MPWKLRVTLFILALPLMIWCGLTIAEALAKIYDAGSTQFSRLFAPSKPPAAAPDASFSLGSLWSHALKPQTKNMPQTKHK